MHKSFVYGIDALLVVGTLALVVWAFLYSTPLLNTPTDGVVATGAVLFSFERGDFLLIDDNPDFSSPQRISVRDRALITLEPGTYYWMVEGVLPSEIRQITVESVIDLQVRASESGYDITNAGDARLNVDVYDKGVLTGNIILVPDESSGATGDAFIGGQHA